MALALAAATVADEPNLTELEARLGSATGAVRLKLLNDLAERSTFRSVEDGRRWSGEALALARRLGDRAGEAEALYHLAVADSIASDHRASIAHAEQALAVAEELGARKMTATCLNVLGIGHRMLDEHDTALELYNRSLEIDRDLGNLAGVARTLSNVANVHFDRGDLGRALEVHREALAIERTLGDSMTVSVTLNNIGTTLYRLGDNDAALQAFLESLELEEQHGRLDPAAATAANIGNIFERLGQLDRAQEYYQRGLDLHTEVGNLDGAAGGYLNLGNVAQGEGRLDDALALYGRALELGRQIDSPTAQADALDDIGTVRRQLGEYAEALGLHRQALALREKVGIPRQTALSLQNIGITLTRLGRLDDARPHLERALDLNLEVGAVDRECEILTDLADLHAEAGDFKTALEYSRRAAAARERYLNERSNDRAAELETRYRADARQRENELLARENEIRRLEASRARLRANLALVVLGVVLVGVGALLRRYRDLLVFWRRRSLVGHYRIVDTIAEGGMGVVHRAESLVERSQVVALKLIRAEYAADPETRRRFLHEAAVVDQIDHPNVVRVYERGEDSGRLYIAMELLDGPSLADLITRGDRLPITECVWIMRQLADAVTAVHGKGVVHRDLKPGNVVLVERDGDPRVVKLLDFGLARSPSLTRLTQTGAILGTLAYLPPEQITEQRTSAAGDVYSLGVVCYELLTLCSAFPGGTPVEVITQVLRGEVVPPRQLRPEIPEGLERLVLDMMATDPDARPSDGEVAERLAAVGGDVVRIPG